MVQARCILNSRPGRALEVHGRTASNVAIAGREAFVVTGCTIDGVTVNGDSNSLETSLGNGVTVSGKVDLAHGGTLILEADGPGRERVPWRGFN